jgi:hypothetical protein
VLREHEPAVRLDVELPLLPRDDPRVDPHPLGQLGRETRGPGVVAASGGAVVDVDEHGPQVYGQPHWRRARRAVSVRCAMTASLLSWLSTSSNKNG